MLNRTLLSEPGRRRFLRACVLAILLLGVMLPLAAAAQMHEFTGEVEKAGGQTLVVANRMGDSVRFTRIEKTRVTGDKSSWGELAKGDRVTVSWKEKREAHTVRVRAPRKSR